MNESGRTWEWEIRNRQKGEESERKTRGRTGSRKEIRIAKRKGDARERLRGVMIKETEKEVRTWLGGKE